MAKRLFTLSVLLAGGVVAAGSALAQGGSVAYCAALADRYARYVGTSEFSPRNQADRRSDPEARLAMSQCHQGQAAAAIPVLERRLRDAGVGLPTGY
ncbi:MAG TPA: hypothetical protein VFB13_01505 [Reyranella sp.]|jgi:hypothetical protein|nr:hypothetical protein [Reyranella sp.]